jgi:hypothetical protein
MAQERWGAIVHDTANNAELTGAFLCRRENVKNGLAKWMIDERNYRTTVNDLAPCLQLWPDQRTILNTADDKLQLLVVATLETKFAVSAEAPASGPALKKASSAPAPPLDRNNDDLKGALDAPSLLEKVTAESPNRSGAGIGGFLKVVHDTVAADPQRNKIESLKTFGRLFVYVVPCVSNECIKSANYSKELSTNDDTIFQRSFYYGPTDRLSLIGKALKPLRVTKIDDGKVFLEEIELSIDECSFYRVKDCRVICAQPDDPATAHALLRAYASACSAIRNELRVSNPDVTADQLMSAGQSSQPTKKPATPIGLLEERGKFRSAIDLYEQNKEKIDNFVKVLEMARKKVDAGNGMRYRINVAAITAPLAERLDKRAREGVSEGVRDDATALNAMRIVSMDMKPTPTRIDIKVGVAPPKIFTLFVSEQTRRIYFKTVEHEQKKFHVVVVDEDEASPDDEGDLTRLLDALEPPPAPESTKPTDVAIQIAEKKMDENYLLEEQRAKEMKSVFEKCIELIVKVDGTTQRTLFAKGACYYIGRCPTQGDAIFPALNASLTSIIEMWETKKLAEKLKDTDLAKKLCAKDSPESLFSLLKAEWKVTSVFTANGQIVVRNNEKAKDVDKLNETDTVFAFNVKGSNNRTLRVVAEVNDDIPEKRQGFATFSATLKTLAEDALKKGEDVANAPPPARARKVAAAPSSVVPALGAPAPQTSSTSDKSKSDQTTPKFIIHRETVKAIVERAAFPEAKFEGPNVIFVIPAYFKDGTKEEKMDRKKRFTEMRKRVLKDRMSTQLMQTMLDGITYYEGGKKAKLFHTATYDPPVDLVDKALIENQEVYAKEFSEILEDAYNRNKDAQAQVKFTVHVLESNTDAWNIVMAFFEALSNEQEAGPA